jgi:DNA replication protein DnaC
VNPERVWRPLDSIVASLASRAPEPEFSCQECRDRGFVVVSDGGAGTARTCGCRLNRPMEERLRLAGVGADLLHARMENLQGHLRNVDLSTFPDPDSCVTLMGPTGTGKSHLAVALLAQWLERGRTARFLEASALVSECRACFDNGEQPESVIRRHIKPDLLVLDEAYADRETPLADEVISILIRRRLRFRKALVTTTNLSERQLEAIEPRVMSRSTGLGAIAIDTTGLPDWRRAAGGTK